MSEFDAADGRRASRPRRRRHLRRRPGDAPPLRVDDGPQRRRRGRRPGRGRRASGCAPSSVRGGASTPCPTSTMRRPRLAGSRATAIAESSALVSRAATPLLAGEANVGSWASECLTDPLGVSLATKGDMLDAGIGDDGRPRRRPGRGDVPDLGHRQVVRVERGGPHRPADPRVRRRDHGDVDRRRRDAAPLVPGGAGPVRHAGLGAGRPRSTSRPTRPVSPRSPGRCCRRRRARAARRR